MADIFIFQSKGNYQYGYHIKAHFGSTANPPQTTHVYDSKKAPDPPSVVLINTDNDYDDDYHVESPNGDLQAVSSYKGPSQDGRRASTPRQHQRQADDAYPNRSDEYVLAGKQHTAKLGRYRQRQPKSSQYYDVYPRQSHGHILAGNQYQYGYMETPNRRFRPNPEVIRYRHIDTLDPFRNPYLFVHHGRVDGYARFSGHHIEKQRQPRYRYRDHPIYRTMSPRISGGFLEQGGVRPSVVRVASRPEYPKVQQDSYELENVGPTDRNKFATIYQNGDYLETPDDEENYEINFDLRNQKERQRVYERELNLPLDEREPLKTFPFGQARGPVIRRIVRVRGPHPSEPLVYDVQPIELPEHGLQSSEDGLRISLRHDPYLIELPGRDEEETPSGLAKVMKVVRRKVKGEMRTVGKIPVYTSVKRYDKQTGAYVPIAYVHNTKARAVLDLASKRTTG